MPKLEYFLICESISVDQETNRVSIFNVLEDLHPVEGPPSPSDKQVTIINQCVALAVFNREPEDEGQTFNAELSFNMPDGTKTSHKIPFQMERNRQRLVIRFLGMPPIAKDGALQFDLTINGTHVGSHTINLFSKEAPVVQQPVT